MTNNGTLTVAPVTAVTDKQTAPSCRFTITCALEGFPIEIQGEGRAGDLKIIVDRLKAIGAQPPMGAIVPAEPTKPAGIPACPVHHSAMKEGRHGYFCPKKSGADYCKETA